MERDPKQLIEKDQIIETVTNLFISTDNRDWKKVEECFDSQVLFDMTSMAGREPVSLAPHEITKTWMTG
jgi:hypothetical protein